MVQLLALVERILASLANATGILTTILGFTSQATQEHTAYYVETVATNTQLAVSNPTYGLSAIHADLAALRDDLPSILSTYFDGHSVSATIDDTPSWYTPPTASPDASTIANEVWNVAGDSPYDNLGTDDFHTYGELVKENWASLTRQLGFRGLVMAKNPYFSLLVYDPNIVGSSRFSWTDGSWSPIPELPDWSSLTTTDTPLSFLQRTQPSITWTLSGPASAWSNGETVFATTASGPWTAYWRFDVSTLMLRLLKAAQTGAITPPTVTVDLPPLPPVWPGLEGVTLGTAVPFTENVDIAAEMDGVIVTITTNPTRTGEYKVGSLSLWYGVGRIAFEDDEGHLEPWQYLAWNSGIHTPSSMAHASGVHLQVLGGAEGTVTPWTINPS